MWKVMRGGKVVAYGPDATEPTRDEQRMLKNHGYKVLTGVQDDPHPSALRAATCFRSGVIATGNHNDFDSLRDAPPKGDS